MRKIFTTVLLAACSLQLGSQPAQAQLEDDIRDALRNQGTVTVVKQADSVTCTDFEVIVNRDCGRGGVQFIILSKGKFAPYRPSMVGDTLFLEMLSRDVPRLPTAIPRVTITRGQTVRTIPLRVVFGDTAWVDVVYTLDSVRVTVIDSIPNVLIHEAPFLPPGVLLPFSLPKESMGTTDIQRYLKKKRSELENLGNIICLPAGYYQCIGEPVSVTRLGRRDSVNEIAGRKVIFFQLTDTSADARSQATHILGGSE